jgi:phage-related protein
MNGDSLLTVVFYRTRIGREPVRDWLKSLEPEDRKIIGEDIKLVQYRWPLGMPLVRKLEPDLWEVRIQLSGGRIVRICFTVRQHQMALLHGFIKKSQKTPENDLNLARSRRDQWLEGWQSDE